jgi:hypothetical protein
VVAESSQNSHDPSDLWIRNRPRIKGQEHEVWSPHNTLPGNTSSLSRELSRAVLGVQSKLSQSLVVTYVYP